jgi:Leu/Phe-tRNA-protein transferase
MADWDLKEFRCWCLIEVRSQKQILVSNTLTNHDLALLFYRLLFWVSLLFHRKSMLHVLYPRKSFRGQRNLKPMHHRQSWKLSLDYKVLKILDFCVNCKQIQMLYSAYNSRPHLHGFSFRVLSESREAKVKL